MEKKSFVILQYVVTIQVYIVFFVSCQKWIFLTTLFESEGLNLEP
jgi:hypothetical protein